MFVNRLKKARKFTLIKKLSLFSISELGRQMYSGKFVHKKSDSYCLEAMIGL